MENCHPRFFSTRSKLASISLATTGTPTAKASRMAPEESERILFEWAYPRIARYCRDRELRYPSLGEDGDLSNVTFK